jgi:hypothetical protein
MENNITKVKDSIPRATVGQILLALVTIARENGKTSFERVRQELHSLSTRNAPASTEAMWTVARDALSDLQKLGYIKIGVLPRKRSEVDRLRETPCELNENGQHLTEVYQEQQGRAFDELLVAWMNSHLYYRMFITRLIEGPLYVPDVTSFKQLAIGQAGSSRSIADSVVAYCSERLTSISYPGSKIVVFEREIRERLSHIELKSNLRDLDVKVLIDTIQDKVVIPSFLAAESLPFDAVTFQHMIKVSQDFLSASWTSSNPTFEGRVVFLTCDFNPDPRNESTKVISVIHHGKAYTNINFPHVLKTKYLQIGGSTLGYISAYALRALSCMELSIQPIIFERCLEDIIRSGSITGLAVYTELPFTPPPSGEDYVVINNQRVGLIKIVETKEG